MKRLAAAAALAVAGAAARRHLAARDAMAAVASDLRNPLLPFLPETRSARLLPLFRMNSRIRTPTGRGVTVAERNVGEPRVRALIFTPDEDEPLRPGVLWIHGAATSWARRKWRRSRQPAW